MYANATSTENIYKNDERDEQLKSEHDDSVVEFVETMNM